MGGGGGMSDVSLGFCEGLEALEGLHGLRFGGIGLLIFGFIIGCRVYGIGLRGI